MLRDTMNAESYREQILKQSIPCLCQGLRELFAKKEVAASLEKKCDFLKRNADLDNPAREDRAYLVNYEEEVRKFKSEVRAYHESLYQRAASSSVYFALHDAAQNKVVEYLALERAQRLLQESNPLMTIHCSRCDQQIDVAVPYADDE